MYLSSLFDFHMQVYHFTDYFPISLIDHKTAFDFYFFFHIFYLSFFSPSWVILFVLFTFPILFMFSLFFFDDRFAFAFHPFRSLKAMAKDINFIQILYIFLQL